MELLPCGHGTSPPRFTPKVYAAAEALAPRVEAMPVAIDTAARRTAYRENGWNGFDPSAKPMTYALLGRSTVRYMRPDARDRAHPEAVVKVGLLGSAASSALGG